MSILGANNDKCPIHDKCGLTFSKGCSVCPEGYKNDGCTCRRDVRILGKDKYGRGAGYLLRRDYHGIFTRYIADHRRLWFSAGSYLTPGEKDYLSRFFPRRLVDQVRVYEMAGMTGAFSHSAGATTYGSDFIIVRKGNRRLDLLKHEFVHICQYDRLGQSGFARQYADEYVDYGYNERLSPLERQADEFAAIPDSTTPTIKQHLGYCE